LAALPAEIEIPDSTESNPDRFHLQIWRLQRQKFDSDIIDMGEGIHFHMPKKFKTKFESTPCDLTAERERLQNEARKKAEAEQKEKKKPPEKLKKQKKKEQREKQVKKHMRK